MYVLVIRLKQPDEHASMISISWTNSPKWSTISLNSMYKVNHLRRKKFTINLEINWETTGSLDVVPDVHTINWDNTEPVFYAHNWNTFTTPEKIFGLRHTSRDNHRTRKSSWSDFKFKFKAISWNFDRGLEMKGFIGVYFEICPFEWIRV